MSQQYTVQAGGGLFGLCLLGTVVLAVLNFAGVIHVSLWVVFAPLIGWAALCLFGVGLFLVAMLLMLFFGVAVWAMERSSGGGR